MITDGAAKNDLTNKIKKALAKEPGLTIKELAERLNTNRQFMAGVLRVLEERDEVNCRQVGRRTMKKHRSFRGIGAVWLGGTGRDTFRYGVLLTYL